MATRIPSAMVSTAEANRVPRPPIAATTGPPTNVPNAVDGVVSAVRVARTRLSSGAGVACWNSAVQIAVNGP
jgi:hypothetical protein